MTFNLHEAVTESFKDAAKVMQRGIRRSAIEHGWHPDVVRNISVEHGENGFEVKVPPTHADDAFVHEYGNESKQPTAVIRKYDNSHAINAVLSSFGKRLGGK